MKKLWKKRWIKILSVILILFLMSQIYVYWRFLRPQPVKCFADTEHTYSSFELDCENDGKRIYGVAYVPNDVDGKIPTVIMSHGLGVTADTWTATAQSLAMSGIACYAFDFCGGSDRSRSDGSMLEMSIMTEKNDLLCVIDMIKGQEFADTDSLFLMGESQGGMVSSIAATEAENIRGMILYYPALMITSTYDSIDDIPDTFKANGRTVGKVYCADIQGFDVYDILGKYTGPVQIQHGTADNIVDMSFSEKAVEVYENASLIQYSGELHGFSAGGRVIAAQDAYRFIAGNIG